MNLSKLFETQKTLDEKIYKRFPGLKEEDWSWKITALLVELGECANEWRGFKKWSAFQEPRLVVMCHPCSGVGYFEGVFPSERNGEKEECAYCHGTGIQARPLLEEYVDCLHFFISIAIELEIIPDDFGVTCDYTQSTVEGSFNKVFSDVASIDVLRDVNMQATLEDLQNTLHEGFSCFVGIGEKYLGFTWEQIEAAYFEKNQINIERQNRNY